MSTTTRRGGRGARLVVITAVGGLALAACGTDDNTTAGGAAPAAAVDDCATGAVTASGSSAQKNAIDEWVKAYQAACPGATINYQPVGSGAGIQQFTSGQTAFAGSDSALKEDEAAAARARCGGNDALNLPMVVGPIAIGYNLAGVEGLQLKPATIAKIFNGAITRWDDAAIQADNPGVDLPGTPIQSFHRSDSSGTTENLTRFMVATAGADWPFEAGKEWTAAGGQGVKGSDGVAQAVQSTPGSIGYMELSYAENSAIPTAKVGNGAGEYAELTPESASRAVAGAEVTGSGNDVALSIDYNTDEEGAYPIVLVTYEITCSQGLDPAQLALVQSFLGYTASDEGQEAIEGLGYAPLPNSVQARVQDAVEALS